MRAPHRDVLACRGLAQRGKLSTEHRALNFLAKQGDNGIVWTVLRRRDMLLLARDVLKRQMNY